MRLALRMMICPSTIEQSTARVLLFCSWLCWFGVFIVAVCHVVATVLFAERSVLGEIYDRSHIGGKSDGADGERFETLEEVLACGGHRRPDCGGGRWLRHEGTMMRRTMTWGPALPRNREAGEALACQGLRILRRLPL